MTARELINKAATLLGIGSINTSPDGAIALAAVYSCIKSISETVGMLPLNHYLATDKGRVLMMNAVTKKVSVRPNNYTTASDFYQAIIANVLLYGNGYAIIYRDSDGEKVRSMQVVPSYYVDPKFADGNITYDVTIPISDSQQVVRKIPQMDMIHLKGVGFDNIKGKSPVEYAAEAFGFGLSAQKYGAEFFKNGAHLKGFIEMPSGVTVEGKTREEKKSTIERIKDAILSGLKGESSAGGIGVLENGMKFQAMSLPNDQAQFLESRKFSREEIAAMFRIPAYMVGEMANAIKSNIEQQSIEFIKYAVMPWVIKLEQELEYKILTVEEEYFKFDVNSYMRGTALERAQYLKELRYAGIISKQEARVYEDLPIEGEGDFMRSKNEWGKEEYDLEIEKRIKELKGAA